MKPHPHAEVIKAWADGVEIQWRYKCSNWQDCHPTTPPIDTMREYRVKPADLERAYPVCQMTWSELCDAWVPKLQPDENGYTWNSDVATNIANAALRHACDTGQIITREEFDLAVGDRAKRDMAVAKAVERAVEKEYMARNILMNINTNLPEIIKGVTQ